MKRTTCKHVVTGLALLACLSLCAPATAHATVLGGPGNHASVSSAGLGWLATLWDGLRLVITGGGQTSGAVAKNGAAANSSPAASQGGGATIDDTSQINPDGHR
jgi:hypothetical protein